ncbi:hypothetical protein HDE_02205 [Halotydeus destructor]|nr:hypothetical protein HDE_02205 [Halotydeus destructor]
MDDEGPSNRSPRGSIYLAVPPVGRFYSRQNSTSSQDNLIENRNDLSWQLPQLRATPFPAKGSISKRKVDNFTKSAGTTMAAIGFLALVIGIIILVVPHAQSYTQRTITTNSTKLNTSTTEVILDYNADHSTTPAIGSLLIAVGCLFIIIGASIILAPQLAPPPPPPPYSEENKPRPPPLNFTRRASNIEDIDAMFDFTNSANNSNQVSPSTPTQVKFSSDMFTKSKN